MSDELRTDPDATFFLEPTEAEKAAEANVEAYQKEEEDYIYETNNTAFQELQKAGYTPDEAYDLYNHPDAQNYASEKLREQAYENFMEMYPAVDIGEIPPAAWKEFHRTGNLVQAFERHNPLYKGFAQDMPKYKAKPKQKKDPFEAGFDSVA